MSMDCKRFEELLEPLLDGSAAAAGRREADEHLSRCARCRELDALVRDAGLAMPDEVPVDLTADVLRRTSGAACTQARRLLCEQVDGGLAGVDAELLQEHGSHCTACRSLEVANKD